jgi:RNA polymerase sigma factor (sigma-70 family)
MRTRQISEVVHYLRSASFPHQKATLTDSQLLASFIERRDEAAVTALILRHGPMVWGVCRRLLGDHHHAEDAFQATFLVLVRRAASIASRELLANWLYGVARQTAIKARATTARQRARERQITEMPERETEGKDIGDDLDLMDEELSRLPNKYRIAIVLGDLEGLTRKEVAQKLGLPEGTVAARLARARALLAKRLRWRGVVLSAGALTTLLSHRADGCVPSCILSSTIKSANLLATGQATAGVISTPVAALTKGMLTRMLLSKIKKSTVLLIVGLVSLSCALLARGQREAKGVIQPGLIALPEQPPKVHTAKDELDLSKIDRTIKKEPEYRSKKPLYCLLVFGRQAKKRVWLALDGDLLYVDRTGNADLTGPDKKVEAKKQGNASTFEIGDIREGKHTHTNVTLGVMPADIVRDTAYGEQPVFRAFLESGPGAGVLVVLADVVVPGLKGDRKDGRIRMQAMIGDARGVLQFADRPEQAPIISFGGPWRMALFPGQALYRGRESELATGFGAPGLGAGTFAFCSHEGLVPEHAHPVLDVTFPPSSAGDKPVTSRWALKERCCTFNLYGNVVTPKDVGTGLARVKLSLAGWKEGKVAPAELALPVSDVKATPMLPISPLLRTTLQTGDKSLVWSLCYSKDGKALVAASIQGVVKVWDVRTGQEIVSLSTRPWDVYSIGLLPDGKSLLTGHWKESIRRTRIDGERVVQREPKGQAQLWDLATRKVKHTFQHDPPRGVSRLAVSPDGKTLATLDHYSVDQGRSLRDSLSLWEVSTGKLRGTLPGATVLAFSPDSRTLAVSGSPIRLVDVSAAKDVGVLELDKDAPSIPNMAFSPDGKTLVGSSYVGHLCFWDVASKTALEVVRLGKEQRIMALALSPDSKTLALAVRRFPGARPPRPGEELEQPRVELWDVSTRKKRATLIAPNKPIASLAFHPNGKTLAAGTVGGVQLWEVK